MAKRRVKSKKRKPSKRLAENRAARLRNKKKARNASRTAHRRTAHHRKTCAPPKRYKRVKGKGWQRAGGGCGIGGTAKFPCDDQYTNLATRKDVTFYTTMGRHFSMPDYVPNLGIITRLSGVKKTKR